MLSNNIFQWSHLVLVVLMLFYFRDLLGAVLGANMSVVNFQLWHSVFQDWQKVSKKSPLVSLQSPKIKANVSIVQEWEKRWVGCVFSYQIQTASKANTDKSPLKCSHRDFATKVFPQQKAFSKQISFQTFTTMVTIYSTT